MEGLPLMPEIDVMAYILGLWVVLIVVLGIRSIE